MFFRGRYENAIHIDSRRQGALVSIVGNRNRYARIRAVREAARDNAFENLLLAGAKRIDGFAAYLVTENGEIFSSLNRRVKKLSAGTKPSGYKFVGLHDKNGVSYKHVHRLVAQAFIPNPNRLPEVNHKNGNKADNKASNLEWVTRSGNACHALNTGLNKQIGLTSCKAKLNAEQVKQIYKIKGSCRRIGIKFGVSAQTVWNIKNYVTYKEVLR